MAGRYRLDHVLAEGGMGIVYMAWHVMLMRPVALKMVRSEYVHNPEVGARFLEEARAGARITSIHAADVLDFGLDEDGFPYLVMELLEGSDLRAVLNERGSLPEELAVEYILQACEAIGEAHQLGIVHRDLKPENLFLTDARGDAPELIKVLDFGVSKRLGRKLFTWTNEHIGSPHYMAPEQMLSPSDIDSRADIWSLGAILFELVAGQPPFDGATVPAICHEVLKREAPPLRALNSDASTLLERVLDKCLRKDPKERYQNIEEVSRALSLVTAADQHIAAIETRVFEAFESLREDEYEILPDAVISVLPESGAEHAANASRDEEASKEEAVEEPTAEAKLDDVEQTLETSAPVAVRVPAGERTSRGALPIAVTLLTVAAALGVGVLWYSQRPPEESARFPRQADDATGLFDGSKPSLTSVADLPKFEAGEAAGHGKVSDARPSASSHEQPSVKPAGGRSVVRSRKAPRRLPNRSLIEKRYALDEVEKQRSAPRTTKADTLKNPYPSL